MNRVKNSIDNMIEKRLDKYYAKKTAEAIYDILKLMRIKIKYSEEKNCYVVKIKKIKEDAQYYRYFYRIYFNNSFEEFIKIYNIDTKILYDRAEELLKD